VLDDVEAERIGLIADELGAAVVLPVEQRVESGKQGLKFPLLPRRDLELQDRQADVLRAGQ
jgi:hypothetical protein